jgi:hypothetical protein
LGGFGNELNRECDEIKKKYKDQRDSPVPEKVRPIRSLKVQFVRLITRAPPDTHTFNVFELDQTIYL